MYAETDCYELHPTKDEDKKKYALVNIPSYILRRKRAMSSKFMTIPNDNVNFRE